MLGDYKKIDEERYLSQEENEPVEIDVCISMSFHKNFKVKVSDYEILDQWVDEDGNYNITRDFQNCNLYNASYDKFVSDVAAMEKSGWITDEIIPLIDNTK